MGVMFQFLLILWCYKPFMLLGLITLIYELWFKKPYKENWRFLKHLSNTILHAPVESHLNPISQVLMVKNQTNSLIFSSLTLNHFFGHNLCLDIQTKNESPLSMFNLQNISNN